MAGVPAVWGAVPVRQPFVGRDGDLRHLVRLAEQAAAGRGSLVLLVGEPGIGKTRLAEELAVCAAPLGLAVRWAACWEDEGAPAYLPWAELLYAHAEAVDERELAHDLGSAARVVGTLAPALGAIGPAAARGEPVDQGDPAQQRFRVFDAVTSVVRRAAGRQPLLLVLDDLHQADVPSWLLLRFLARELRTMRVLVVGAYRPADVGRGSDRARLLDELAQEGELLALAPLRDADVARLLGEVAGGVVAPETLAAVGRRGAGNPLFVLELGRLLAATGGDPDEALAAIPEGVRAVLDCRVSRLSTGCVDLLSVAAVVGQKGAVDVVATAAGLPPGEALDRFDEGAAAGLVRIVGEGLGSYAFAHPLVREVLYDRLPLSVRADLHRRVAETLEAGLRPDTALAELALHFLRAWPAVDAAKAVEYCRRAGERALGQLAYEDAADHFRRALDAATRCPADDRARAELLLFLGDARLRAGDLPEARAAFEAAAELARAHGWPEDLARAALGFGAGLGGFEVKLFDRRQIDLLEEALDALGREDSRLRAWTLARLSVALSFVASEERRRRLSEDAVAMARRLADPAVLAYALAAHSDAIPGPAHVEQRLAEASEIVRLAQLTGDRGTELLGRRLRLVALLELGEIARTDAEIDAYARTAEALRQPLYLWYVPLWRGMRALMRGRLADCERLAAEAGTVGERAHSENAAMSVRGLVQALAAEQGDVEGAEAVLDGMIDEGLPLGPSAEAFRVNFLAHLGQSAAARSGLARLVTGAFAAPHEDAEWLNGACQLAEAAAVLGDVEAAEALYPLLEPYAHRFVVDGIGTVWFGSVAYYLARLAQTLGDPAGAAAHFERALTAHRRVGAPLLVAHVLQAYAAVARGEQAEEMRREAATIHAELGLTTGPGPRVPESETAEPETFRREGEFWTLVFAGEVARVKDTKGMRDIARLLARPGYEVHVLDLVAEAAVGPTTDAGEAIDATARRAYRARLADLEELIDEAEEAGDEARATVARAERDALVAELTAAYGLGGRARRTGDPAERARSAVSWRIRDALARIDKVHSNLGRHLRNSLRTGTFCSYQPEQPVAWRL